MIKIPKRKKMKQNKHSVTVEIDYGNLNLVRNVLSIAQSGNHMISLKTEMNEYKNLEINELMGIYMKVHYSGSNKLMAINYDCIMEVCIHNRRFLNE